MLTRMHEVNKSQTVG